MPASTPQAILAQQGAILQVQLTNPGGGSPVTVQAMIDTGASITTINADIASRAGLQQTGETQLGGVGGIQNSAIYAAALTLPDYGITVNPVQVATVPGQLPGVDMLIGRDILSSLNMNYQGGQGAFTLTKDESAPSLTASGETPGTVAQPAAAPQSLPQPPQAGFPWVWVAGGAAAVGLGIGGLFLFKVL